MAERKRQLVRGALVEAAATLLTVQEFEETTVDQIVAAAGMSRRTFSRYFESKEDVVVHMLAGAAEEMCAELRDRPADEPPAVALRHALSVMTRRTVNDRGRTLHLMRLILHTPALLARFLERQTLWQTEITDILARRAGLDADTDLRPALAAGVALSVFQTSLRRWEKSCGTAIMDDMVDQGFALVTPVFDLTGPAG